ncbi:hypothetical protein CAPTEDRAFT_116279, partial [Capitella teleta]
MSLSIGQPLPDATLFLATNDGPQTSSVKEIFSAGRIAAFVVPGAFTPACHRNHLPGYLKLRDELLAKGIDKIVCLAVNDAFVLSAWARETAAVGLITMISDGNGDFTRAAGMEIDLSDHGIGQRSRRYSFVTDKGIVTHLNVE